jgi:hypothetical protein
MMLPARVPAFGAGCIAPARFFFKVAVAGFIPSSDLE